MEIETKYAVLDAVTFATIARIRALGSYRIEKKHVLEHQRNRYFDTPDLALATERVSIRVRQAHNQRIGTVKCNVHSAGALQMRRELEVVLDSEDHPVRWPASEARDAALGMLAGRMIAPVIEVRTRRQRFVAHASGRAVVELALDEGAILAGGRVIGFRELEAELLPAGTLTELLALSDQLAARFGLSPEPRGKKSRGMALLRLARVTS